MTKKYILILLLLAALTMGANVLPSTRNISTDKPSTNIVEKVVIPFIATPATINGTVLFKRANSAYWDEVKPDTEFFPLDEIKTTTQSSCEIKLIKGHVIRLEENSHFILAGQDKEKNIWQHFKITTGKLWAKIVKGTAENEAFTVETPQASIAVKGTLFSVIAPFGNISAFEGILDVFNNNVHMLLEKGFETFVDPSGVFQAIQPLSSQSLESLKAFADSTTLPTQPLQQLQQELQNNLLPGSGTPAPAGAGLPAVPSTPLSGLSAPAPTAPGTGVPNVPNSAQNLSQLQSPVELKVTEDAGPSKDTKKEYKSMLYDVTDKVIGPRYLLLQNPALLAEIYEKKSTSLFLNYEYTKGFNTFINDTRYGGYRYNPGVPPDPLEFNAGIDNNIHDEKTIGIINLGRGSAFGIYLVQQDKARFLSSNVLAEQDNYLILIYGLALPITERLSAGLLLKGLFNSTLQTNSSYSFLNNNRNIGNYDTGFDELLSQRPAVFQKSGTNFAVNLGFSYDWLQWWNLGISMENLFFTDDANNNTNKDQILHLTSILHNESLLLDLEIAKPQDETKTAYIMNLQYKMVNIPWLGQVEVGFGHYQNSYSETVGLSTSFKLWFMQFMATHQEDGPLPGKTFNKDSLDRFSLKIDF
ncbi:MAG: FecR family protein [Candidatus Margulisbacteria bacterium]|nr:FecR family protein [Candidatus Margulisiibacteriota bacterium]